MELRVPVGSVGVLLCASTVPSAVTRVHRAMLMERGVSLILFWSELKSASVGTRVWTKSK